MVETLGIRSVNSLCKILGHSRNKVEEIVRQAADYVELYVLIDRQKSRDVISAVGPLRECQNNLLQRLLLPRLIPIDSSHGGITGRSPKTNALTHADAKFVFKTDIAGFYPSIHCKRVYRLFIELDCSPDVARICTRLSTFDHHLATGLVTSPIIADRILRPVDLRIAATCRKCGLRYSRYVDDIAISGRFDLETSGAPASVVNIITEHGFRINAAKHEFQAVDENCTVTGIRVRGGDRLDVSKEYADRLRFQLTQASSLARGNNIEGDFFTENQLRGKVNFVTWVNPGRTQEKRLFRSIDWRAHKRNALRFGLVAARRRLIPKQDTCF